jgi:uncharacterized protein DUF6412
VSPKVASFAPLWGWLLCLAVGLHAIAPGETAMVSATAAVTLALFTALALALACRARTEAALSGDPRPARVAVRARTERTAFLSQRDPDASGKPRPRAPGHCRTIS